MEGAEGIGYCEHFDVNEDNCVNRKCCSGW